LGVLNVSNRLNFGKRPYLLDFGWEGDSVSRGIVVESAIDVDERLFGTLWQLLVRLICDMRILPIVERCSRPMILLLLLRSFVMLME
jgi:hypothetical protein